MKSFASNPIRSLAVGAIAASTLVGIGLVSAPAQAGLYPTDQGAKSLTPGDFLQSVPQCNVASGCNVTGDNIARSGASFNFSNTEFFIGQFAHPANDYVTVWEYGGPNPTDEKFKIQLGNWDGTNFNPIGSESPPTNPTLVFGSPLPPGCGTPQNNICNSATFLLSSLNVPNGVASAIRVSSSSSNHPDISAAATPAAIPEPASTLGLLALGTLGAASTLKRKLKPSKSTEKETTKVG
jgi:hypothetical protein